LFYTFSAIFIPCRRLKFVFSQLLFTVMIVFEPSAAMLRYCERWCTKN